MFKFIFLLCLFALALFAAQLLQLHHDTALSLDNIKQNPDWLLWSSLILATPALFFSFTVYQWWSQRRTAHKAKLGHQRQMRKKISTPVL
jgi:amino acid transporter